MDVNTAAEKLVKILLFNAQRKQGEYRLTPMLWGPPGVGKSSVVRQALQVVNAHPKLQGLISGSPYTLKDLRLSTMLPVDVRGIPALPKDVEDETARFRFVPPEFLPQQDQKTLLFFDEVNTAPPSNQVVAYEIALDYALGGHALPDGTLVVMAGNRTEDRGATYEMPAPLANRLVHLHVEPDAEAFFEYGTERGLHTLVLGFIKFRKSLLYQAPSGKEKAFPSPRSWEFVSLLLQQEEESDLGFDPARGLDVELLEGIVGRGAAAEFDAYARLHTHLPDIDAILEKGGTFTHDNDGVKFAYLMALVSKYVAKPTEKRAEHFVTALTVLPEELQAMGVYMTRNPSKPTNALVYVTKAKDFTKIRDAVRGVIGKSA